MLLERKSAGLVLFFASFSFAFGNTENHDEASHAEEVPGIPGREAWRGNTINGPWVLQGLFCPAFYADKNLNFPDSGSGEVSFRELLVDTQNKSEINFEERLKSGLPHLDNKINEIENIEKEVASLLKDYESTYTLGKNLEKAKKLRAQIEALGVSVKRTGTEPNPYQLSHAVNSTQMGLLKAKFYGYRISLERAIKEVGQVRFKNGEVPNALDILKRSSKDWDLPMKLSRETSYQKLPTSKGELQLKEILSIGSRQQWKLALDVSGKIYAKSKDSSKYEELCSFEKSPHTKNVLEKMIQTRTIKLSKEECDEIKALSREDLGEKLSGPFPAYYGNFPLPTDIVTKLNLKIQNEFFGSPSFGAWAPTATNNNIDLVAPLSSSVPESFRQKLSLFPQEVARYQHFPEIFEQQLKEISAVETDLKNNMFPVSYFNDFVRSSFLKTLIQYEHVVNPKTGNLEVYITAAEYPYNLGGAGYRKITELNYFRLSDTPLFVIDKSNIKPGAEIKDTRMKAGSYGGGIGATGIVPNTIVPYDIFQCP